MQIIANDTGSNIKPTQDQINAINRATTLDDAKAVALQAGWGTYVSIFEEQILLKKHQLIYLVLLTFHNLVIKVTLL